MENLKVQVYNNAVSSKRKNARISCVKIEDNFNFIEFLKFESEEDKNKPSAKYEVRKTFKGNLASTTIALSDEGLEQLYICLGKYLKK